MTKAGTVAPRERVNITYRPATGDASEGIELPLKLLVLADLCGRPDPRPVEERAPISIDRDNFQRVMAEHKLCVRMKVPDRLSREADAELEIDLRIEALTDLTPDGIVAQVPALQKLLGLRRALVALKGPMGNLPAFRKKIQVLLGDEQTRQLLKNELGGPREE